MESYFDSDQHHATGCFGGSGKFRMGRTGFTSGGKSKGQTLYGKCLAEFRGKYGDWGFPMILYLARQRSGASLREIGEWAGGKDYKTVSKAIERFGKKLATDKSLARRVKRCAGKLSIVET